MSRIITLEKLGEYCTTRTCKNCALHQLCEEHNHGCPEGLRVPEIAEQAAVLIQNVKLNTWQKKVML